MTMKYYNIPKETMIDLYNTMLKIRMVEEAIGAHYHEDNMHTPIHLCIGQEAIAAGVCQNLEEKDRIFSNHRNHGHYIAKGGNIKAMISELHNKETGCSHGRGGSMHLVDNEKGIPITSSIVAGGVPIATGSALTSRLTNDNCVSIAFLGDAASEEGVVFESLAFAVLKNLPIVYICENNLYSVGTPINEREKESSIYKKFTGLLPSIQIDGNNVFEVYEKTAQAINAARRGEGPTFIECLTYRWKDHHDTRTGTEEKTGYRTEEEWASWVSKCPIKHCYDYLVNHDIIRKEEEDKCRSSINKQIEEAFLYAIKSDLPKQSHLYKGLLAR